MPAAPPLPPPLSALPCRPPGPSSPLAVPVQATFDELGRLMTFCAQTGVRPVIDRVLPMERARDGFAALLAGDVFGKIVLTR